MSFVPDQTNIIKFEDRTREEQEKWATDPDTPKELLIDLLIEYTASEIFDGGGYTGQDVYDLRVNGCKGILQLNRQELEMAVADYYHTEEEVGSGS